MPSIRTTVAREPALTYGGVTAFVAAVIALLVAFGVPLTDVQTAAILGVVAVAAPVVTGFLTRRRVTPVGAHIVDASNDPRFQYDHLGEEVYVDSSDHTGTGEHA